MKWGRQRGRLAGALTFVTLIGVTGCQARSSVEAAQTAIVSAQTALPATQATAQAAATMVSGAFTTAQPMLATVQALLAGAQVDVTTSPDGVANDAVSDVKISGKDLSGGLSQVDPLARKAAVGAALVAAEQYYPNATIALEVLDASGATLVSGSIAPGQQTPSIQ